MYAFSYCSPRTLEEVSHCLLEDDEAIVLAGGMSLLPAMKLHLARPSLLIDLSGVASLKGISVGPESVTIGAMTSHADVSRSSEVKDAIFSLCALAGGIGDRQVRNRGTIGGSIANGDPASCYPSAVLGLGATVRTNVRDIPAEEFFLGLFETALGPREIIVSIEFPLPEVSAYVKFHQPASRFALVGVFVSRGREGTVRVAVTGAGPYAFRVPQLEQALTSNFSQASAESVEFDPNGLSSDMHGTAEYRAALIPVLTGRAVHNALHESELSGAHDV